MLTAAHYEVQRRHLRAELVATQTELTRCPLLSSGLVLGTACADDAPARLRAPCVVMGPSPVRHVGDVILSRQPGRPLPRRAPLRPTFPTRGRAARRGARSLRAGREGATPPPGAARPAGGACALLRTRWGARRRASGVPTPASRHACAASPPGGAVTGAGCCRLRAGMRCAFPKHRCMGRACAAHAAVLVGGAAQRVLASAPRMRTARPLPHA